MLTWKNNFKYVELDSVDCLCLLTINCCPAVTLLTSRCIVVLLRDSTLTKHWNSTESKQRICAVKEWIKFCVFCSSMFFLVTVQTGGCTRNWAHRKQQWICCHQSCLWCSALLQGLLRTMERICTLGLSNHDPLAVVRSFCTICYHLFN